MFLDVAEDIKEGYFLTMILAPRNCGKTYSVTQHILEQVEKNLTEDDCKWRFLYIRRRWKNELESAKDSLFSRDDEKQRIVSKGKKYYYVRENEQIYCGECAPLSSLKARGQEIANLRFILFDEFTAKVGELYLPNEFFIFASAIETLVRLRTGVQIVMLGNAGKFINPYTIGFCINIPFSQKKYTDRERSILYRIYDDEKYMTQRKDSPVARLFKGSAYDSWAGSISFFDDDDRNVESLARDSVILCTIEYTKGIFGLYASKSQQKLYIHQVEKPSLKHFVLNPFSIEKGKEILTRGHPITKLFRALYTKGYVYYTSKKTKSLSENIIDYLISI